MSPELKVLLELQTLDLRVARLDARLTRGPEDLAAIDRDIELARGELRAAEEQFHNTERERRRAEGQLEAAEAAVEKYGDQQMQARTNDEYRALGTQIRTTRGRISDLEDQILELMEAADDLETKVGVREREFASVRTRLEGRKDEVRAAMRRYEDERARLQKRRRLRAERVPATVLARYERIRGIRGHALARAADETCGACHVRLRPQLFEEVRAGRTVLACESCSRLLFVEPGPAPEAHPVASVKATSEGAAAP